MELFVTIPFTFDTNEYEVRIYYDTKLINVLAFQNGRPANGYRYQLKIPKDCSAEKLLAKYPVPELVEVCQKHIRERKWKNVSPFIQQS